MDTSIPSLLLVLGLKSALSWAVVLLQRRHMSHSFSGVFCVSLATVDALLTSALSAIYFAEDFLFLGLQLTRHHVCLLLQLACATFNSLHWPVLLAAGLDHRCTLGVAHVRRARTLSYAAGACALWAAAVLYVLLASGFRPALGDEPHLLLRHCLVPSGHQSRQVAGGLLLAVGCVALYALASRGEGGRPHVVRQALLPFLSTWAAFLALALILLVSRTDVPAFLDMNVPWVCFLNSFAIAAVSCSRCQALRLAKDTALTDGFCHWRFSLADEGET